MERGAAEAVCVMGPCGLGAVCGMIEHTLSWWERMGRNMSDEQFLDLFFGAWLLVFVIVLIGLAHERRIKRRFNKKYGKKEYLFHRKFLHFSGLNLPENALCKVHCLRNWIVIEANGQEFVLPVEKIVDVSAMTKTEFRRQHVPFVGGTIADSLLGGDVFRGTHRYTNRLLVFTYTPNRENQSEMQYLIFNITGKVWYALNFIRRFRRLKRKQKIQVGL